MAKDKSGSGRTPLIVAIVLLVVAAGVYFYQSGSSVEKELGNKLRYVCVETGEIFTFDRGKSRMPPLENPKTGRRTLIACYEKDGIIRISNRTRPLLNKLAELNKVIDPETLQVRKSP